MSMEQFQASSIDILTEQHKKVFPKNTGVKYIIEIVYIGTSIRETMIDI